MTTLFKFKSAKNPAYYCNHSSSQPLRIADILRDSSSSSSDSDEEGDQNDDVSKEGLMESSREVHTSIDCSSPRRIVGRLLSGLRRGKVKRRKERSGEKDDEREFGGDRVAEVRSSMDGFNGAHAANLRSETAQSGQCRREESFNLGVGCCLLYLVAASKNELDKMMEMRMQMETIIKKAKEEFLHTQHAMSKPSDDPSDMSPCSSIPESLDFENQTQLSPQIITTSDYGLPESSSSAVTVCDRSLKFEAPKHGRCFEGMDQMEAELEVELQRLQFHLDREKLPEHPPQLQRRLLFDEEIASAKSLSVSSGEVIDPIFEPQAAAAMDGPCGVPPHELERKLHELLEARQQEQIKELEDALDRAKRKLREKEMEVSWWKDTAQLISRHAPETSRFTSTLGPKLLSP